ncbi:MAG TPA: haloacid dehalogenase type II [Burkholderiaceae bacterium]|nr:haloacid dehalogenase type II [Burkholderiaceae bacterium]
MPIYAPLTAVVFDAYGTLFDVHSVIVALEKLFPGHGSAISHTWRSKQVEYTQLRTLSDRYAPFSIVTRDALRYACAAHGMVLDPSAEDALMCEYERLDAYPEVHRAIERLRGLGLSTAILSNGDPAMLGPAVAHADLAPLLDAVLSVDTVGKYKTAPEAYSLATDRFGCVSERILFVSSNGWDVAGAAWCGFRTCWINRTEAPADQLGVRPHHEGRTLDDVAAFAGVVMRPEFSPHF